MASATKKGSPAKSGDSGKGPSVRNDDSEGAPTNSTNADSFHIAANRWEDTFLRKLVRQALKKGSFVSISYPYTFAYVLVKFGYIPKSIAEYSTVDNKRAIKIPSLREYMTYMRTDEGDWLWMRGEISYCATYVLYTVVEDCVREYFRRRNMDDSNKSLLKGYSEQTYVTSIAVFMAVVITQPFVVLSYREIGQYIGKEDIYSFRPEIIPEVFKTPGMLYFFEGMLARYVLLLIPSLCGALAGYTWESWLGTPFLWLPGLLEWCIDEIVGYWVSVAVSPLEIAFITFCVSDSGIEVGTEQYSPKGRFLERFVKMWKDGQLKRSTSYFTSMLTMNLDAFVVS